MVPRGAVTRRAPSVPALVVVLVWASCFVLIKGGLGDTPPIFAAALRALIAGLPLALVAAVLGRLRPPPGGWGWLLLLGLTNTTFGLAGMYLSVGRAGAAIPAVLANSQALLVAPFAPWLFGERVTPGTAAGLLMGLAGVSLTLAPQGAPVGTVDGGLLALLASAGIAGGSVIVKHIASRVDVLTATAWQYLLGSVPLLAWAVLGEDIRRATWTPSFLGSLLFLGLAGSAGASLLWYRLLQRGELLRVSAYTFLTPVFGLLLAILLFGESLTLAGTLGVALTIAGVAVVERTRG